MMLWRPPKQFELGIVIRLVTADEALEQRVRSALAPTRRFRLEQTRGSLLEAEKALASNAYASLLLVEFDQENPSELAALNGLVQRWKDPPAIILISRGMNEAVARKLLRLRIADWLPRTFSERDLLLACEHALAPGNVGTGLKQAQCTAFIPALGGAGNTTLSLAAANVLAKKLAVPLSRCCVIDLNLQSGAVADNLGIAPTLNLEEIAAAPERLDQHLLEVMLSRHASGLTVLAAPPAFAGCEKVDAQLVVRLLDLAAGMFDSIVIDMPRFWSPWCESVLSGSDNFYIVTEMTVAGLRQARWLADVLQTTFGLDVRGSVIVNKVSWLGRGGVKKAHAKEMLGDRLAGFVADRTQLVREAQNRGVLLSDIKRSNRIEADLLHIIAGQG